MLRNSQYLQESRMTPCEILRSASVFIREWQNEQIGVKEESLTDWLLYDVSKRLPFVRYKAYTRHEEANHTGADWEWWILLPSKNIKMRVQAKKILQSDNYPSLAHSNRNGFQIDKLIADARKANAISLFALYSKVSGVTLCDGSGAVDEGVFLTGAVGLHKRFFGSPRRKILPSELLAKSVRLSCLLCCSLKGQIFDPYQFLRTNFDDEFAQSGEEIGVHLQLPAYVESLIHSDHAEESSEGDEFYHPEFQALVVWDLRNPDTLAKGIMPNRYLMRDNIVGIHREELGDILKRSIFERLKNLGLFDPDVDLWWAVMHDEKDGFEAAIGQGANVNVWAGDVIARHGLDIKKDPSMTDMYNRLVQLDLKDESPLMTAIRIAHP